MHKHNLCIFAPKNSCNTTYNLVKFLKPYETSSLKTKSWTCHPQFLMGFGLLSLQFSMCYFCVQLFVYWSFSSVAMVVCLFSIYEFESLWYLLPLLLECLSFTISYNKSTPLIHWLSSVYYLQIPVSYVVTLTRS